MYERWLREYEEVRELEGKEIPVKEVEKIVLNRKRQEVIYLDSVNVSLSSSQL